MLETDLKPFLSSCDIIDWHTPEVLTQARQLAHGCCDDEEVAEQCFEFVRDKINHSWDFQQNPVTCKASEALAAGTGFCYSKSHLLAALLRANQIPAALCYQRLTIGDQPPFCLHSLNAVYLPQYGWYRVDARGNKAGVNASFTPPVEALAYSTRIAGEADFPRLYAEPLSVVLAALSSAQNIQQLADNLPDLVI